MIRWSDFKRNDRQDYTLVPWANLRAVRQHRESACSTLGCLSWSAVLGIPAGGHFDVVGKISIPLTILMPIDLSPAVRDALRLRTARNCPTCSGRRRSSISR